MKNFALSVALLLCTAVSAQYETPYNIKKIDSLISLTAGNKNDTLQMQYYFEISNAYYHSNNIEKAESYAYKLLSHSEKINYQKGINIGHMQIADINLYKENFLESIKHGEIASAGFLKLNDMSHFLNSEYVIGYAYGALHHTQKAIGRLEKALRMGRKEKMYFEKGKLYFELSNNYFAENNFPKALENLQKALEKFGEAKNTWGIYNSYSNLADVYTKTGDWSHAKKYALLHFKSFDNPRHIPVEYAVSLRKLGNIEMKLGNYNAANNYLQKSLDFSRKNKFDANTKESSKILAELYLLRKEPKKAIEAVKSILAYKTTTASLKAEMYNLLQKSYQQLNDTENASLYKNKLVTTMADPKSDTEEAASNIEIYKDLAEASHTAGDYKEAYEYYDKFATLEKERFLSEKTNRVNELQAKFELTDKDLQLKDLTINKQKNELDMARQKNTLLGTIAVLGLIFIISLFLYWRYRANKKSNLALQYKNEVIETSLNEKNILLKEIHHRVKNNLQLIISLLNIQARENNHSQVDDFLEKGRGRIISMALIHQNLYEANNLAKVNFQEYLENLINSNAEAYGQEVHNVTFSIRAEDMYFDVQTSIPLGLIINELICNAMKHAFSENDRGAIEIAISKNEAGGFELRFSDNGIGIKNNKKEGGNFGTDLVRLLAMQLKGEVAVDSQAGTVYTISFEDLAA